MNPGPAAAEIPGWVWLVLSWRHQARTAVPFVRRAAQREAGLRRQQGGQERERAGRCLAAWRRAVQLTGNRLARSRK